MITNNSNNINNNETMYYSVLKLTVTYFILHKLIAKINCYSKPWHIMIQLPDKLSVYPRIS